tara:strand:- start:3865 stop:4320 length:456 start_codon:yes stop_codon:yes gene_type:complete
MNINKLFKAVLFSGILLSLFGCADDQESTSASAKKDGRWYDISKVKLGESVYEKNCISCHLTGAQGIQDWKKTLEDGSYPPPPLNGTAHAWHHSIGVLLTVINEGGIPNGGKMPAFKSSLSQEQKLAVIAYFQSFWPDDIYTKWESLHEEK